MKGGRMRPGAYRTGTLILLLLLILAHGGPAAADIIHLANGGKVEGRIVERTAEKVVIQTKYGRQTIDVMDIEEIEEGSSERQEYQQKKAKLGERDADGHYKLGMWCKEKELAKEAEAEFEKAIEINPDHEGARKELGYEKYEGQWLTEDEVKEKKGYKKWQGMWIAAEEYDRRLKEKIQRDKEKEKKEAAKMAEEVKKATSAAAKEYEGVPWENRHRPKSKYFSIECNSTKKIADKYAWLMDRLYEKYKKVFAAFSPENRKCQIFIHRSHQEFMQMRRRPAGVGGYYMPGRYQLVAFHGSFGATSDTTTVLAHEGTHLFQDLIGMFGRPVRSPIWLIEGMAVLMEAAEINWSSGKISIKGVSRDRLVALQSSLEGKRGAKPMTLSQVMNTQQRQFGGLHYAYAGMFTYWMIQGSKSKKHALVYNDYVKIATGPQGGGRGGRRIDGSDFQKLLDKHLKCSLSELEEKWKKWVLKQKPERLVSKRGSKYICKKLGFSVTKPSVKWKGETEDVEPGEMVVFTNKSLNGRIAVRASGNFMNYTLESLVTAIKKSLSDAVKKGNYTDYKFVSEKFDTVKGHKVYDYVVLAKSPKSTLTKELMKRRTVYFVTPDNLYSVRLMAPPDKYDECLEAFIATLEGFEIDL